MDDEDRQVLLGLLDRAFEAQEGDGLLYLDIQKIFYHLREQLDPDNPVVDLLPYYWYIDGPVSDTVQATVDHGTTTGVLTATPTDRTGEGRWHERVTSPSVPTERVGAAAYRQAESAIEQVVADEYDVFADHEEKIDEIYADAPYPFQRQFKFDVLPELDAFAQDRPWAYDADELVSRIELAEAYLPVEESFEEFNAIFSRYVDVATRCLDAGDDRVLAERLVDLSEGIWRLFCRRLRIVAHDPFYDDRLDAWEREYERTRQFVAEDLVEFRRAIEDRSTGVERVPADEPWASIAADLLDE